MTVMVETTEKTGEKKLSVTPTKTLTLKGRGVESGLVRQAFSHGRTKTVVVEKVKSRIPTRPKVEVAPAGEKAAAKRAVTAKTATGAPTVAPAQTPPAAPKPSGMVLRELTP